ncbi:MAG TPA: hypothetical protein VKA48_03825 [Gammaproteobacteria bacterium]|nr:hypothetical protein [Gammaproteobacteria bacterium]
MKMLTILTAGCLALATSVAQAGPEVSAAMVQDHDTEDRSGMLTFGVSQGPVFTELGFRSEAAIQLAMGIEADLSPLVLRTGALYIHGHEETHRFDAPYGHATDDGSGVGGMAEVSLATGSHIRPFVRYQGFRTSHEFMDNRRVGQGFGDPVTHREDRWSHEVMAGIRLAF